MNDTASTRRITFHDAIETMEVDFTGMTFADARDVDAFYDEADRLVAATGRRWFFIVNYTDCVIDPGAWARFAERGKSTNIRFGLGTVRVGASEQTREQIRGHAGREM